jgi:hypothetical protein
MTAARCTRRRERRRVGPLALAGALLALTVTACGSSTPTSSRAAPTVEAADAHAQVAGARPSRTARMICAHEVRTEIGGVLARTPIRVTTPTWVDHRYSCDYVYPQGTVTLSVTELDGADATTAYFDQLGAERGRLPETIELGQGAFQTADGSIVVRKDFKVLLVDVAHLRTGLTPRLDPATVASTIAVVILGCWT